MFKLVCTFTDNREDFHKVAKKNYYYTNIYDLVESVNRITQEEFSTKLISFKRNNDKLVLRKSKFDVSWCLTLDIEIYIIEVDQYIKIKT